MARQTKGRKSTGKKKPTANERQELFVKHYLATLNATEAAIKAGYSEKTAASQGSRLLNNVKVQEKIDYEMSRLRERMTKDANRVYAALWLQIDELTEQIQLHHEAKRKTRSLYKEKAALLYGVNLDSEDEIESSRDLMADPLQKEDLERQLREINFKMRQARLEEFEKESNYYRAQEIRAKLLHDLFDRAGYKPTDRMEVQHSGGIDLSYMTNEELEKAAAIL